MGRTKAVTEAPPVMSSYVQAYPQAPARKAEDYLKAYQGYPYTAITAIAQETASIELKLFSIKYVREEPVIEEIYVHPALSVLQSCNPMMTSYELFESTQVYLELVGEAFWVVLRDGKGEPQEIYPIRPDWVSVVPDPVKIIAEYIYYPGGAFLPNQGVHIPVENMIPFKYFNPLNPYRGKGTVQAGAMAIDIQQFANEWNRNFFFNSAQPGMVFTSDKKYSESAIKRFVEQWQSSYGGRQNSHKVAFLSGGFKVEKVTQGAQELDFVEQQKVMRDDVLAVFKTPKTILGLTDDVNRANAEATTMAFMERVVTPRMRKITGTLTEFYIPMFKSSKQLFMDFVDPSPEDTEAKLKYYENGRKYGWLTPNEIRIEENLEPVEGGDTLAPLTVGASTNLPEGQSGTDSEAEPDANEEDKPVEEGLLTFVRKLISPKKPQPMLIRKKRFKHMMQIPTKKIEQIKHEELTDELRKDVTMLISELVKQSSYGRPVDKDPITKGDHERIWTEDAKEAYWLNFVEKATQREVALRKRIQPLFEEQGKEVIANLDKELKSLTKEQRKGLVTDVLFDIANWVGRFMAVLVPYLKEVIIQEATSRLTELDSTQVFNPDSENTTNYLRNNLASFVTEINQTTKDALRVTLQEGVDKGESVDKLRKRVQVVMSDATNERSRTIARTEAIRASNFAAMEAYVQSGTVEARQWLSERDDRVCPFCLQMDGTIVALDKDFFKKGEVLTVRDDKGKERSMTMKVEDIQFPPLHTLCRCTMIPITVGSSKNFSSEAEKARDVVNMATQKAQKIVEEATKKANSIVLTAEEKSKTLDTTQQKEVQQEAVKEASDVVNTARGQATQLLEAVENKSFLAKLVKRILG